jgi:hypothetical protein
MFPFIQLFNAKTDPMIIIIVLAGMSLIWFLAVYFSKRNRILRSLKGKELKQIGNFSDGDNGKIIGKVVFAGETLYAPLSKRQCVFYHLIVEEYRSTGKTYSWVTIFEEEGYGDVVVSDGTGYAIIAVDKSMNYLVPDSNYTSRSFNTMKPELKQILARHNVDPTGFLGFSKSLRCSEGILEKGELFTVAGEGQWNETKDHGLNISSSKVLVIIPQKNEKVILTDDPEAIQEQEVQ